MNKFVLACSLFFNATLFAQCIPGQTEVIVIINADSYPSEISWNVSQGSTILATGTSNSDTVCVPSNLCTTLNLFDAAGDGICCGYGVGTFYLVVAGDTIAGGPGTGNYGTGTAISFNCPPGTTCTSALPFALGTATSTFANEYYTFTATVSGNYNFTTVGLTTCDTKIWIYGNCNGNTSTTNQTGTLFYNDNDGALLQSNINAYMSAGSTYIIRVGTAAPCNGTAFTASYAGPVTGCTDPTSCNFDPLATVSGNCLYYPNPLCPNAPDLTIDQNLLISSLQIQTHQATNCQVVEGCMAGYGTRTVLAFDTKIDNIGMTDYYIGSPTTNPSQFTFNNCHGHAHYEGYADYVLYKPDGGSIPIGHKNGFCVLDLTCPQGITPQYGCSNMGITAGCGDIYGAYLDCQWIDITDVDSGSYTLAVKVNWDQSPDALGRIESSFTNNWAQCCIRITQSATGVKGYQLLPNCQPYVDCAGTAYGNAIVDCSGTCGGTSKKGDLDNNGTLQTADAQLYQTGILSNTIPVNTCKDLSSDNKITVWDAALELNCALNGAPNNSACVLPNAVVALDQLTEFGYLTINTANNYIDVYIRNGQGKVGGYEFNTAGFTIASAVNLVNPAFYPATPSFNAATGKVYCISYVDSMIPKNIAPAPLVRLYYSAITDINNLCITEAVEATNKLHQATLVAKVNACLSVAGIEEQSSLGFSMYPNPTKGVVNIIPAFTNNATININVMDAIGRVVKSLSTSGNNSNIEMNLTGLTKGIYIVEIGNGKEKVSKQLVVE
jgi:Lysyl oxidase/Secretion system C-terminal sorting domain